MMIFLFSVAGAEVIGSRYLGGDTASTLNSIKYIYYMHAQIFIMCVEFRPQSEGGCRSGGSELIRKFLLLLHIIPGDSGSN